MKTISKNVETTVVARKEPAPWMKKAHEKSIENREKLMETGLFFQGKNGEVVRGIFLEPELHEDKTKNDHDIFVTKILRMSSHKEQTLSVLQSITQIVDKIVAIAEKHDNSLKSIMVDVTFKQSKNSAMCFISDIVEVPIPTMSEVA
jgi:hypothetical protein